jgi:hypothetical protein
MRRSKAAGDAKAGVFADLAAALARAQLGILESFEPM